MPVSRRRPLIVAVGVAGLVIVLVGVACSTARPVTAGPATAPRTSPRAAPTFTDWPTYHLDAARTGYDPSTPAISTLASAWTRTLDGAVYAEPLMVNGILIV
ncbi:MAG TPA: hypothetical protein VF972_10940, partial [Actinomycetota bacterium]